MLTKAPQIVGSYSPKANWLYPGPILTATFV